MKLRLIRTSLITSHICGKDKLKEVLELQKNDLKLGDIFHCIYSPSSHNNSSSMTIYLPSKKKWLKIYSSNCESVINLFEPVE